MPLPERPRTRSGGRVCAYADISPDFSGPSISLSIVIRTRQRCFNRIGHLTGRVVMSDINRLGSKDSQLL